MAGQTVSSVLMVEDVYIFAYKEWNDKRRSDCFKAKIVEKTKATVLFEMVDDSYRRERWLLTEVNVMLRIVEKSGESTTPTVT